MFLSRIHLYDCIDASRSARDFSSTVPGCLLAIEIQKYVCFESFTSISVWRKRTHLVDTLGY